MQVMMKRCNWCRRTKPCDEFGTFKGKLVGAANFPAAWGGVMPSEARMEQLFLEAHAGKM